MYKTLFMDADDTLFDFGKAQRAALFSAFESLSYPINEDIYALYDAINLSFWKKLERGEVTKEQLVYDRFRELFRQAGFEGDAYRAEDAYQSRLGEQAFWLDGAKEGVKRLSEKYDIFITTNGHGDTQKKRVQKSGLGDYIKGLFISELVGVAKPKKEYYDYCFAASKAKKETTLCIGDSLTSDIKGGLDYGLDTMWCNFRNDRKPDFPITYIVRSWEEILMIL